MDPDPGHEHFFKIYRFILTKAEFLHYFSSLAKPFRDKFLKIILSLLLTVQVGGLRAERFFQDLVDISPRGSGS